MSNVLGMICGFFFNYYVIISPFRHWLIIHSFKLPLFTFLTDLFGPHMMRRAGESKIFNDCSILTDDCCHLIFITEK